MSGFRVVVASDLTPWEHARAAMVSGNRFAAWCVGEPFIDEGESLPAYDEYATEQAARAAYPEIPALGRFSGQDDTPLVVLTPLTVISRLTDAEKVAIFTSADSAVVVWRSMAMAAQEIRSDDERTAQGFALLVSKGLLASNRPAELMAL